ncbi:MAG TPA: hypothetical protein VGO81_08080, partial [Solirubrobacteraceae bacterium]|nr:hypothetical protein [Solirubrobacteraceae bacterium]
KLRKPSAAAWAVNQLVRTQRDATRELFAAGDAVRAAQADVLAGRGDARALRDAGARERDAVGGLVETARGLLGTDGHDLSATTLERIADTLHAAALDDDARDEVREGRLERELRHVGLGLGEAPAAGLAAGRREAGTAPAPAQGRAKEPGAGAGAGAGTQERASQLRAAKERAGAEAAQAAERVAARRAARAAVAKAAKAEERAGHALRAAEERRERAATALAQADAARDEARAAAAAAADEHRRARAALEEG